MSDEQLIALMICLFRVAEKLDPDVPQRPLRAHAANSREILRYSKATYGGITEDSKPTTVGLDKNPDSPYGVICDSDECGKQGLTEREYKRQMSKPGQGWICPRCGGFAKWDDERLETAVERSLVDLRTMEDGR